MPNWETQFEEHEVFTRLATLEELVSASEQLANEISPDAADDLVRLGYVCERIGDRLEKADPYAASYAHLKNITNNLQKAHGEIASFQKDKQISHLTAANNHAELGLVQSGLLFRAESASDIHEIQQAVATFRRSIGQHTANIKSDIDDLHEHADAVRSTLSELQSELTKIKERADVAIAQFQTQFSESEKQRREEAQKALKDLRDQESALSTRYAEAQEQRQSRFDDLMQSHREKLETAIQTGENEWNETKAATDEKIAEYMLHLKEKREEVEEVAGAVGASAMSGGFMQVADQEKRAMIFWQGATVVFVGLLVWIMLSLAVAPGEEGIEWIRLAQRVTAALALGGLAAFAGKEAAKHGEKERRNRKMQLEMAAIGPFLASNPKEDQYTIKKTVADRALLHPAEPLDIDGDSSNPSALLESLRYLKKIEAIFNE